MLFLILAIASSTAISFILRFFDKKIHNNMVMFLGNYFVCVLLSCFYARGSEAFKVISGTKIAVILGIISGIFYLMGFVLLQTNIRKNGIILSTLFMRLGVLVPIAMALIIFNERPSYMEVGGIILAIAAIFVINFEKDKGEGKKSAVYLLLFLLIAGGLNDSFANIQDKIGNRACNDQYLLITFAVALLSSVVMIFVKKQHFTLIDLGIGMLVGLPNYYCSRFLLLSLSKLKAIIVYPMYNIGTILLISLMGILLFKEKLGKNKIIGLLLVIAALILLNI